MGEIYFLGDVHGQLDHVFEVVYRNRPSAVIFLGDIEPAEDFHEQIVALQTLTSVRFIPGNHDTDTVEFHDRIFDPRLQPLNLHGRVDFVAGIRIAGLGGIFRGNVWYPRSDSEAEAGYASAQDFAQRCGKGNLWRGGLPLRHRSTIFPDEVKHMKNLRADVLVAHEAPDCHIFGFAAISSLAKAMGVKALFHGHHHERICYGDTTSSLGFQAYSVGFRDVLDVFGGLVWVAGMEND